MYLRSSFRGLLEYTSSHGLIANHGDKFGEAAT